MEKQEVYNTMDNKNWMKERQNVMVKCNQKEPVPGYILALVWDKYLILRIKMSISNEHLVPFYEVDIMPFFPMVFLYF